MRMIVLAIAALTMATPAAASADYQDNGRYSRHYDNQGSYHGPTWRGRHGQAYCRRTNGTTGLIVGGAGGAIIARELDGGRNRTTGTVLGAAIGALFGRELQRSRTRCR